MIKVIKAAKPQILIDNEVQWTKDLDDFVQSNGGGVYNKIPQSLHKDRDKLVEMYNNDEVKNQLEKSNTGFKCAFCEKRLDKNDKAIEHFHPKSIYYQETYDWDNLLLVCNSCNTKKGTLDTKKEPIVHPVNDNPKVYFIFTGVRIYASSSAPDKIIAERTIQRCDLRRKMLIDFMADAIKEFYHSEKEIDDLLQKYSGAKRKLMFAKQLLTVLNELKKDFFELESDKKPFVGYIRFVIKESPIIQDAISAINSHQKKLKLSSSFSF